MTLASAFAAAFSYHQPAVLLMLHGFALFGAWRLAGTTTRALASVLFAAALLHLLAWLMYGSSAALHATGSLIALGLALPIVLRSSRIAPLFIGAAALLSATGLFAQTLLPPPLAPAAQLFSALANLLLICTLAGAITADWYRSSRQADRARRDGAPSGRS